MKATDIIFKAKRTDNGAWAQGSFCHHSGRYEILVKYSDNILDYDLHVVNPETLCIGFKDEDGNLWFTGDTVRFKSGKSGVIFLENFCLKIKIDGIFTPVPFSECNTPEIIGNIHD